MLILNFKNNNDQLDLSFLKKKIGKHYIKYYKLSFGFFLFVFVTVLLFELGELIFTFWISCSDGARFIQLGKTRSFVIVSLDFSLLSGEIVGFVITN